MDIRDAIDGAGARDEIEARNLAEAAVARMADRDKADTLAAELAYALEMISIYSIMQADEADDMRAMAHGLVNRIERRSDSLQ